MKPEEVNNFKETFQKHFSDIDEEALVVLKAHLLLEESLYEIISTFVFNPAFAEKANLSFYQKVNLARSISLDNSESTMWNLILKFNTLRNKISHHLNIEDRDDARKNLKELYEQEVTDADETIKNIWNDSDTKVALAFTFTLCLGFLKSFEAEIARFKSVVGDIDKMVNPHRHKEL